MPRPKSKKELIDLSNEKYKTLIDMIESKNQAILSSNFNFSIEGKSEKYWTRNRNIRDLLVHLNEWQLMLIDWIKTNLNNEQKAFLPVGYNWKNYDQLNDEIWKKHQTTNLLEALKTLEKSHLEIMELIDKFNEEELFTKKHFKWTNSTNLGSYIISSTSSHYDWAIKIVKNYFRSINE